MSVMWQIPVLCNTSRKSCKIKYKYFMLWGHPTSLQVAPSRALLNTHTSNCAALFRLPTKQLCNAISSPFQAPNQTAT